MSQDRVMLLIDADNVSVDIMEQALRLLMNQHGGVHVRRAYCTAESALKHQSFFKRMGIKPMVNLSAGKNSTDIALAVDAVDLVLAERPEVVVIASSDSDFAPLVQRLREKGCVVRGIGQKGKTGQETQDVYDDFTVLEHHKPVGRTAAPTATGAQPRSRATAGRKTAGRRADVASQAAAPIPVPLVVSTPAPVAAALTMPEPRPSAKAELQPETAPEPAESAAAPAKKAPAARKTAAAKKVPAAKKAPAAKKVTTKAVAAKSPARKRTAAAGAEAALPSAVEVAVVPEPAASPAPRPAPASTLAASPASAAADAPSRKGSVSLDEVLRCLPELKGGQGLALNVAAQRLRGAQLLGKSGSSLKLFASLGDRFELLPPGKPSQVRLKR